MLETICACFAERMTSNSIAQYLHCKQHTTQSKEHDETTVPRFVFFLTLRIQLKFYSITLLYTEFLCRHKYTLIHLLVHLILDFEFTASYNGINCCPSVKYAVCIAFRVNLVLARIYLHTVCSFIVQIYLHMCAVCFTLRVWLSLLKCVCVVYVFCMHAAMFY